jgi:hypothetical protein
MKNFNEFNDNKISDNLKQINEKTSHFDMDLKKLYIK